MPDKIYDTLRKCRSPETVFPLSNWLIHFQQGSQIIRRRRV